MVEKSWCNNYRSTSWIVAYVCLVSIRFFSRQANDKPMGKTSIVIELLQQGLLNTRSSMTESKHANIAYKEAGLNLPGSRKTTSKRRYNF